MKDVLSVFHRVEGDITEADKLRSLATSLHLITNARSTKSLKVVENLFLLPLERLFEVTLHHPTGNVLASLVRDIERKFLP